MLKHKELLETYYPATLQAYAKDWCLLLKENADCLFLRVYWMSVCTSYNHQHRYLIVTFRWAASL